MLIVRIMNLAWSTKNLFASMASKISLVEFTVCLIQNNTDQCADLINFKPESPRAYENEG